MSNIYTFRVKERHGERENEFEVEVPASDEREAIVAAVAEVIFCNADEDEGTPEEQARKLIALECGDDWTPESYFAGLTPPAFWDNGSVGESLFTIYRPSRVCTEENTPSAVMRRCVDRYYSEGMFEHLRGRLLMVLDELSNSEIARIFAEDIHTQREMEGS